MRFGVVAAAVCVCIIGMANAGDVKAAIRRSTDIPPQGLGPALTTLAREFDFQVLYRTEIVEGRKSLGVSGAMTAAEALDHVLSGTGLTYKYLDDRTVAILPIGTSPTASDRTAADSTAKEGKTSSGGFLSTQMDQGKSSSASSLGNQLAIAQEDTNNPSVRLEEIVVTAQKRSERLQDVPISVSILSGSDLDRSSFQGVGDALNSVPGVSTVQSTQGGGSTVTVRGVVADAPLFSGGSPIAYYLDGVPFGLVDSAIVPDINAYDLQRVEVLRGPQGTLYGASALNGVVRILTNDADLNAFDLKVSGSDSGTQGGGNNYRANLAVNEPIISGKLAVRAVVGYESQAGWIDKPNSDEKDANNAILRTARFKIKAEPVDDLTIGLSAWLSRQDYGASNLSDAGGTSSTRALPEPISTNIGSYGLSVGYTLAGYSISSETSYLNYASNDINDFLDVVGFDINLTEHFGAHVLAEEINMTSPQIGPWRWTAGLFYRDAANSTLQTLEPVIPVTLDWTDSSKSYAVFAEVTRQLLDKLELTLGGRYFHDTVATREDHDVAPTNPAGGYYYATSTFNATTPRAVLTWHPAVDNIVYASYSEGFRSGAQQPYYAVFGIAGFPPAKPDKLHNYEIGSKNDFLNHRIAIDTAVYFMDWKDVQQTIQVPFPPSGTSVGALVNGTSASGVGVDLAITVRPLNRLAITANISWNDLTWDAEARDSTGALLFKKGDRLPNSPEKSASLFANYTVPLGTSGLDGRFAVGGNYSSPLISGAVLGTASIDSNSLVTTRAAFGLESASHWQATLYGDNLNNWDGASSINAAYATNRYLRIRPRTIGLQFDYKY